MGWRGSLSVAKAASRARGLASGAGEEEAARRLGVEGESGQLGRDTGADGQVIADPVAVAALAAGVGVHDGGLARAGEEGQGGRVDGGSHAGALDHLPEMAAQAEAGDVGGCAQAVGDSEVGGVTVEAQHRFDGVVEPGGVAAPAAGRGEG